ncbi:MAG: efflux transporter outer membrane subunit [Bdellovibrionota bacterium]|jgi:multidrug efflux system outer membrane protein
MKLSRFIFTCVLVSSFAGCSMGPDYQRKELNLPEVYNSKTAQDDASIANIKWWELFEDKKLVELINIALKENKDAEMALAAISEARALLGVTRANQFPQLGYSGGFNRYGLSEKTFSYMAPYNDFGAFTNLIFEVDLWGRLRRATEAQRAQLLATEYSYQALTITLVAEVAKTYMSLVDLDSRVKIAERTLKNRRDATKLIRSRFQGGVVPELDVNQAEIEEGDAEVMLAGLKMQRGLVQNALSVLLGRFPYQIDRSTSLDKSVSVENIPSGVPADLLWRRPDILASEQALHAQTALIGVAKASRLPVIGLNGIIGLQANKGDKWLNKNARMWNIAANFSGPLFDFGKSRSQVEAAEARTEQALKSFEQTVLLAVQEVDDALVSIVGYKAEYEAWKRQLKAARNASRLARARYNDGVTPYLEVLDVERSLFQAELGGSYARRSYLNAIIQLYKALGGGWSVEQEGVVEKNDQAEKIVQGDQGEGKEVKASSVDKEQGEAKEETKE